MIFGHSSEFIVVPMYIARIPNRKSRPTVLIRQDRREGKKIIKQNLANITHLPLT